MKSLLSEPVIVSGLGISSSVGIGKTAFTSALNSGQPNFGFLKRPGRFTIGAESSGDSGQFIGCEIDDSSVLAKLSDNFRIGCGLSAKVSVVTLAEAWRDAALSDVDPHRIGLVIAGSNLQQREGITMYADKNGDSTYVRPAYAVSFSDTDFLGTCTEYFGIQGASFTLGGASASGQLAVIQAATAVQMDIVDVCIVLAPFADLSHWELQAFRNLGAMGSDRFRHSPLSASRPFDKDTDGFIYGENCAALVIEKRSFRAQAGVRGYGSIRGYAATMAANRNPNSESAEIVRVIQETLAPLKLKASDIDYVNPHGSGSPLGDREEIRALTSLGLHKAKINTTKSIVGHGLTSAGLVELVSVFLQLQSGILHPCMNLDSPIQEDANWVSKIGEHIAVNNVLNLSFGFGGIYTALCVQGS